MTISTGGMKMYAKINERADRITDQLVAARRDSHKYAERG